MLKDKRLNLLAELTPKCGIAADIGTDHGYLGSELLSQGKCEEVWFTDISEPSLNKARQLVEKRGFGARARFFTGDGARPLPYAPDAAIIAGMGGHTICHILEQGKDKLKGAILVLGANTALKELRLWLSSNDYQISDECAVSEAGKYYVLLRAQAGQMRLNEEDLIVGPVLKNKHDKETLAYMQYRLRGALLAYDSASQSDTANLEQLRKETERWQKYL